MERFPKGGRSTAESVERYRYFQNKAERHDIYEFSKELATYLKEHETRNVLFADRSARPAWIGVDEYWNRHYPETPKPGFYFVNPDGFAELSEKPSIPPQQFIRAFIHVLARGEFPEETKSQAVERFEELFAKLSKEKDAPLVFFDTCAHTGMTARAVLYVLENAGFTDIGLITANAPDEEAGLRPLAVIDRNAKMTSCYPFGDETLVRKTDDLVTERDPDGRQYVGNLMRQEIRQIVQDEGA